MIAADDRGAARAVGLQVFTGTDRPCVLSFPLDRSRRQLVQRGIDPDRAAFPVTRNRLLGLRDACNELAMRWEDVAVAVCSRNDSQEAQSLSLELLGAAAAPDALAAMSDELALGALRAAATLGVPVPESLAVSGWDDAAGAGPAGLTTVGQDQRDQGARCARAVLAGKAPGSAPSWSLVVRATTRNLRR